MMEKPTLKMAMAAAEMLYSGKTKRWGESNFSQQAAVPVMLELCHSFKIDQNNAPLKIRLKKIELP